MKRYDEVDLNQTSEENVIVPVKMLVSMLQWMDSNESMLVWMGSSENIEDINNRALLIDKKSRLPE